MNEVVAYLNGYLAARLSGETTEQSAVLAEARAAQARPHGGLVYSAWDGMSREEGVQNIEDSLRENPNFDGQVVRPSTLER